MRPNVPPTSPHIAGTVVANLPRQEETTEKTVMRGFLLLVLVVAVVATSETPLSRRAKIQERESMLEVQSQVTLPQKVGCPSFSPPMTHQIDSMLCAFVSFSVFH